MLHGTLRAWHVGHSRRKSPTLKQITPACLTIPHAAASQCCPPRPRIPLASSHSTGPPSASSVSQPPTGENCGALCSSPSWCAHPWLHHSSMAPPHAPWPTTTICAPAHFDLPSTTGACPGGAPLLVRLAMVNGDAACTGSPRCASWHEG